MSRTPRTKNTRPKRTPISRHRDIMTAPQRPGFVRRWVNDDQQGRIERFLEAGWVVVGESDVPVGEEGVTNKNQALGTGARLVRGDTSSVLMEIEKELYEEDQQAKADEIAEKERMIKAQNKEDGRYGEVSISRQR